MGKEQTTADDQPLHQARSPHHGIAAIKYATTAW